jgi:hypothetical protein
VVGGNPKIFILIIYSTLTIIFTERRNFWKNHPEY